MPTIGELVDWGYDGILVLERESHESRSGMQEETTRTRIACRDRRGDCLELVFIRVEHPLRPTSEREVGRTAITAERYAELAARHRVQDTPEFRRERAARQAAARAAQDELARLTPTCPACGQTMQLRTNRQRGNVFWGCRTFSWSGCRGTRDIPNAAAARIRRLNQAIAAGGR